MPHGYDASTLREHALIGDRNESQTRLMAHDVTGHDLAEVVPADMADVVLPFLARHP